MPALKPKSKAVSAFIRRYPPNVRKILEKIRETVRKAAPAAEETISYMMLAYKLNGILVYFSGFKGPHQFFPDLLGYKGV